MERRELKPTSIDEEMAKAFKAYKEAETLYNFYKAQLLQKFESEGTNCTSYEFSDGSKVSVEYVSATTSRSFDQNKAKAKLKEVLGETYDEDEFYKVSNKASFVKVGAVEYAE